jgi:hypothetical protein
MRHAGLAAMVLGCLAAGTPARAQVTASRGGTTLGANVFGGYDAPLFATNAFSTLQPSSQTFGGADASLSHTRSGRKVSLSLNANASSTYFPRFRPQWQPAYGANVNVASVTQGKWAWTLGGFGQYSPISNTGLFAGANAQNGQLFSLTNGTAFQVSTIRQVDVNTAGSLSYSPTRRTHLQVLGAVGTLVPIDGVIPNNIRLNARARIARDLTRNFRGYIGYSFTQNRIAAFRGVPATNYAIDGVDIGVDFRRPFQITRNTTLSFTTGLVNVPDAAASTFQFTGTLTLDHQFRNSWSASLAAVRDARFVQTFKDPVVFSGVSASTGGMVTGSLGASLSANYSRGNINSPTAPSAFESYSASARLRYDLRRLVGTFVEYTLFRSDIEASQDLLGYPTGAFGRYSVRVGLSFGVNPFQSRTRL